MNLKSAATAFSSLWIEIILLLLYLQLKILVALATGLLNVRGRPYKVLRKIPKAWSKQSLKGKHSSSLLDYYLLVAEERGKSPNSQYDISVH